jgi:hypothetical protein
MTRREGPCGALGKEICRAKGSLDDVGGTEDACPIAVHLVGRWGGGIDARG